MVSNGRHSMSFYDSQQPIAVKKRKDFFGSSEEPSSSTGVSTEGDVDKNEAMELIKELHNALVEANECGEGCSGEERRLKLEYGSKNSLANLGESSQNQSPFYQPWDRSSSFTKYADMSVKPYSCKLCGKKYAQKSSLVYHINVHTGEKPYGCNICGKRYYQNAYLIKHLKVHGVKKRYSCEVCANKFSRGDSLTRHMRLHTGVKPCVCIICGDRFSFSSSLKWHMRKHGTITRQDVSTQTMFD